MGAEARAVGAQAVAVTFTPHPQQVHRPDTAPPVITGDEDRLELMELAALDAVLLPTHTLPRPPPPGHPGGGAPAGARGPPGPRPGPAPALPARVRGADPRRVRPPLPRR